MIWRKLKLILWKNFIVRKRHWLLTLIEIAIPIFLFSLIAYGRSKIPGLNKSEIKEPTYHDVSGIGQIYGHVPVEDLQLWYAPSRNFTEYVINHIQLELQIAGENVKSFSSEEDLLKHFNENITNTIVAIIFKGNDPKNLDYDISFHNKYLMWDTDKLFTSMIDIEDTESSKYLYSGFAAFQIAVDMAFIKYFMPDASKNVIFTIQQFPYPPRTKDSGLSTMFMNFLPLITIFSFIFLCPAVLKRVGEEKHSGIKEFMKMIGIKSWILWFGWLIHALSTNLISIIAIVILMKVPFWGVPYPPIEYSDGVLLFIFLLLYCVAAVTFCFLIATIFNSPSLATVVGILIWILSYFIPRIVVDKLLDNLPWKYKILFGLFPNMALGYGYSAISMYEIRDVGIHWNNMFQSGSGGDNDITMGNVFLTFIVDTIIFMLLTIYIENVKPGKYGIAKPLSFPILNLKYWLKNIITSRQIEHSSSTSLREDVDVEKGCGKPCIQITDLYKKFYNIVAVENLTMTIYENHITVLLGHNGAGKTTTMSILTGMINASGGTILVNGKNIKSHTDEVRQNMGLCPQHNLLFPDLTVMEHLQFFAMLKGQTKTRAEEESEKMLQIFNMSDKKNVMASTLSGGMKRKLCLGMALVGDSKILILDEPTSGMDPESRRKIWDLLLEYRKSRTILITTHFMEEADVLGDQIAIMANGRLQCFGTPMQLKNRYNTGYHLSLMIESKKNINDITKVIKSQISEAELLRQNGENLVYLLPLDKKYMYDKLFNILEQKKNELTIVNIGLSITTLNDVFLKAKDEIDGESENKFVEIGDENLITYSKLNGVNQKLNIFESLMLKRYIFFKRKFFWYVPGAVVGIAIFLVVLWLGMTNTDYYNYGGPKLNLDLDIYGKTSVFYGGNNLLNPKISDMKKFYNEIASDQKADSIEVSDVSQAIIQEGIKNIVYYKKHMIAAAEFSVNPEYNQIMVNAMYSSDALHSLPISINLAMNAVVKSLLGEMFSISVSNSPLKPLYSDFAPSELSQINVGTLWLFLVPIAMLFFMSNFIIFPNLEVSTNFVQIQTMAGVKIFSYWLINIIFDFIICILKLVLLISLMHLLNVLIYHSIIFTSSDYGSLFIILLLYMLSALPFTYLFSYRKTIITGLTLYLILGMFMGITPTVIIVAMEMSQDSYYENVAKYLRHIFLWSCPQFAFSYICVKFSQKYVENFNWIYINPDKKKYLCSVDPNPCCYGETVECYKYKSYFYNEKFGVSKELLEISISFILYFIILCFLNTEKFKKISYLFKYWRYSCFRKSKYSNFETPSSGEESGNTLRAKNLTKYFGNKQIVNNLKLHLKKNECFGLLGVNGAGKTTTFRMLTKDTFFDTGEITISDDKSLIPISESKYSEKIGYCPQEDCLNFFLTGREILNVIGRIKGYSKEDAHKATEFLLDIFDLKKYADKSCLEYSGGNKRKLSSCIAFLGAPNVIMLDEPTSGVDPASRRMFWNILSTYKKVENTSFLLCSHSMEECEALCDEIGIMKNGTIKAQGTLPVLKSQHQKGYTIEVKLKSTTDDGINSVKDAIETEAKAELKDAYADLLQYHVMDAEKTLSQLFGIMEKLKTEYSEIIDDYTINQISLEDIFLSVAKED